MEAAVVCPSGVTHGRIELTNFPALYFFPAARPRGDSSRGDGTRSDGGRSDLGEEWARDRRWDLALLTSAFGRRYHLRPDCGVELLFADASACFLVLKDAARRQRLWADLRALRAAGPKSLARPAPAFPLLDADTAVAMGRSNGLSPRVAFARSSATADWQQRRLRSEG